MAKLDAKARNKLPAKDFAGPARSYPVEDKAHARDAKSRASAAEHKGRMSKAEERKIDARADKVLGKGKSGAKKQMTAKQYERSPEDRKADQKAAKERKEPVSKWEGSKADRAADKKGLATINAKRKGK